MLCAGAEQKQHVDPRCAALFVQKEKAATPMPQPAVVVEPSSNSAPCAPSDGSHVVRLRPGSSDAPESVSTTNETNAECGAGTTAGCKTGAGHTGMRNKVRCDTQPRTRAESLPQNFSCAFPKPAHEPPQP
eukprot:9111283-Pyramimonas_sp.AAC.1